MAHRHPSPQKVRGAAHGGGTRRRGGFETGGFRGSLRQKGGVRRPREEAQAQRGNIGRIEAYLKAYAGASAENELFVGIRPEHIHLAEEFRGAASEPFTAVADFVELLGSELCVYFNAFGGRLICKLSSDRLIRMGEEVRLCFDMEKLKLFDGVGGMRIGKQLSL